MKGNIWIGLGSVVAGLAVAAGAIGAHALGSVLDGEQMESYRTAVDYQALHGVALVLLGLLASVAGQGRVVAAAGVTLALGTVLFSGGIYVWLATGYRHVVHVVPVGGTALIIGWFLLAAAGLAARKQEPGTR